ncbi:hypothetical protein BDY24DRAFT_229406 [Mrakia frigida]|uniref:uncharacterized protein n=1 Tax=Mrakia frigida TaxID=29902 RepID=UPI003FCBF5D3
MFKKVPKPSPHPVLKHSVSAPTPSSSRMAFGKGSGSGRQRLSDLSHLSAVARGKLPAAADDSDAEEDVQGPSTTTTVIKTSKFFSSTTASAKPRPTSHQPRPLRRDDSLSLETFPTVDQPFQSVEGLSPRPMEDGQELPTVDELFDQLRSSTPEDIEMDFPPGFENITPPLDKPSSSAASFISLSPCAPASPQQQLFDQDFSEVFSSPSSMRFGGRRGGRESSMDGYISSSPAPGETPRKRLGTREREESLGRVEEVEDGMEVEVEVVGREEVDLREVCVGTTTTKKGGKGGGGKKVARKEDESSVVASSDVVEEEDEEEERREEKLSVIAKGWRERFTLKKGPSTSPFNKASPLTSRTSLPTPTRPLLSNNGASTSNSTFARTTSTPTNFLSSKNTPSSLASRNQKKDERTPVASLFAKVNPQTNTPRSLPPRFSFAPRLAGKENAGSGTPTAAASASAKEKRKAAEVEVDANAEEEGRRGNGKKKRVVVLDEDDEDEEEEIVPSSSLKEVASPTSSARKRLDVFRFRPKVC